MRRPSRARKQAESSAKQGGKNLWLLGAGSILVAILTTVVALIIYHNSGDIYLDRSRPGFLPDESETKEEEKDEANEDYDYGRDGTTTKEGLEEYLRHFEAEVKAINDYVDPFDAGALSDERLGIIEIESVDEKKVVEND